MDTGNTLLAHLSSKFTGRTEDIAVEALGHILSSSEAARNGLHDVLRNGGLKVSDIGLVVTQSTGEEGGRPDLACYIGGEERKRVVIEAKFWAGLTENQPVTYLRGLPDDMPSALLFVAPKARFVPLWAELRRQIEEAEDVSMTWGESVVRDGIHATTVGYERKLVMTSWAALLRHMESRAIEAGDGAAQNDIQQLRGLAVREDLETLLPMRREQLGPEFPRFVTHMNQLVNDAISKAKDDWIVPGGASSDKNGYKRRIGILPDLTRENFDYHQWLSINFDLWHRFRETPMWITFPGPRNWSVFRKKLCAQQQNQLNPIDFIDDEKRGAIPIYLRMGVEYEAVIDGVVQQIKALSDLLKEGENPD